MKSSNNLGDLLILAQGNRTQNQFALHTGVSSGSLSRFISGARIPDPATLRKIATRAYNNVTFIQLMVAAGHLDDDSPVAPSEIDRLFNSLTPQEQTQARAYMERMVEVREESKIRKQLLKG